MKAGHHGAAPGGPQARPLRRTTRPSPVGAHGAVLAHQAALGAVLAGLAALGAADPARAAGPDSQVPAAPIACADMAGLAVPAAAVGLPTGGVRVTGAMPMAASGTAPRAVGAFCRVTAEIAPVDPAAPPIRMEVNLPESWNGRALMFGGGGYDGSILSTGGTIRLQPADMPIPLGRGYATFGSDSGHRGTSNDGSFATNEEALRNYAYEALKKTRDAAGLLIRARYGRPAEKVYFHGSSNGGKEAFAMIQKYPADIDGAIIFWPATLFTRLSLQHARISRALLAPGAWPGIPQRRALLAAAVAACDGLDGAADGVVSNSRQCQTAFDPATAMLDGRPLRCPDGVAGESCLSDAQIAAAKVMETPVALDGALGAGAGRYPGFNAWGTDLGSSLSDELSRGVTAQGLGTVAPALPATEGMPFMHVFSDQFLEYFVARDPGIDWRSVDPEHPGTWQARIAELANLLDMSGTDLSAFRDHGGKILMVHGMSDQIIPVQATERYFDAVVDTMGWESVAGFFRFYELPGTAHSGNGTAFTPTWDALGALDAWETQGTAPAAPVVTDIYAVPGRTRPLCEYPAWPKYAGSGDINEALSFTCAQ